MRLPPDRPLIRPCSGKYIVSGMRSEVREARERRVLPPSGEALRLCLVWQYGGVAQILVINYICFTRIEGSLV